MLEEIDGGNGYGIKDNSNPDFIVEGTVFDCYSPDKNTSFKGIKNQIAKKIKSQAESIVLNLDDYPVEQLNDLKEYLISNATSGDLKRLKELIIIRDDNIETWYLR